MTLSVCEMRRRDLPQVLEIDKEAFDAGELSGQWQKDDFSEQLSKRYGEHKSSAVVVDDSHPRQVFAFMLARRKGGVVTVLRMAVRKNMRRRGLGEAMIHGLENMLGGLIHTLQIYVPERNLGCQLFFKSLGWRATDVVGDEYLMVCTEADLGQRVIDRILEGDESVGV